MKRIGKMNLSKMFGAAIVVLLTGAVAAGQTTFEASVDRTQVGLGEQFTLAFTLTGSSMGGGNKTDSQHLVGWAESQRTCRR